jgi:hypothetical protein
MAVKYPETRILAAGGFLPGNEMPHASSESWRQRADTFKKFERT